MKVRRHLERLEPMILRPLKHVQGEDWHLSPEGKWSLAQILGHLAISMDMVATALEDRALRTDMQRRASPKQHLLRHLALGGGKLPNPRKMPKEAYPAPRLDPELITAQFRMGVQRLTALVEHWPPERKVSVFAAHPVLGDLNLREWVRFFFLHCRYYEHKIQVRLRWLRQRK